MSFRIKPFNESPILLIFLLIIVCCHNILFLLVHGFQNTIILSHPMIVRPTTTCDSLYSFQKRQQQQQQQQISILTFTSKPRISLSLYATTTTTSSSSITDQDEGDKGYSWVVPEGVPFGSLDRLKFQPMKTTFRKQDNDNNHNNNNNHKQSPPALCTISTRAIGLNFADIFCILGLYTAANQVRDGDTNNKNNNDTNNNNKNMGAFCPGLEYAGIIVDDPTGTFSKGQRVLGFTRFGAYADIVQVPPYFVYPLPDHWTFSQGASFLVQALTAWHGLVAVGGMPNVLDDDKKKKKKQKQYDESNDSNNNNKTDNNDDNNIATKGRSAYTVLIHSAAGGVGLWASEIAARRGATVIGVVGSEEKKATFNKRILKLSPNSQTLLRGDEQTFGRRLAETLCNIHGLSSLSFSSFQNKKISDLEYLRTQGYGVDMVMESLGGKYFTDSFEALNRGGSLVTFGSTSYVSPGLSLNKLRLLWRFLTRPKIDPGTLTSRNIRLAGFNLIFLTDMPDKLRQELKDCILCLSGGNEDDNEDDNSENDKSLRLENNHKDDNNNAIAPLDPVTVPVIGEIFDFRKDTIRALECLKGGGTVGKVVLENNNNNAC